MRRALRSFVCAWLACQLAGFTAAPLVLRFGPAAFDATSGDACCPGVAPGQVCPMHHTKEGAATCVLRNACGSSPAGLLTLIGTPGLLPASPIVDSLVRCDLVPSTLAPASARTERPESPPPRA
jgi:hypothetical protein